MADLDALLAQAQDAAVLGPDDVLVLQIERVSREAFEQYADHFKGGPLSGRVLLVAGVTRMLVARDAAKAEATDA